MKVAYTGSADFQEFSHQDFAKADLDQNKLSFPNGEAIEVDDAVGEALISDEGIFGAFSFEEVTDEEPETNELGTEDSEELPDPPKSGKKAKTQGAPKAGETNASTETPAGNGASTA